MPSAEFKYTDLITSAHKDKPKFKATVEASTIGFEQVQATLLGLIGAHALDTAVGSQLDTLGEWIGQSRYLTVPLDNIYFAWDHLVDDGWDSGIWWDTYSPTESITALDDESYRMLLKMYVAANHWDGTPNKAIDVWAQSMGSNSFVIFTDYQDMSCDLAFSGKLPSAAKAMIRAGLNPFKPESVRVRTYFTNNNDGPIFAWDMDSPALSGYDVGYWVDEITFN